MPNQIHFTQTPAIEAGAATLSLLPHVWSAVNCSSNSISTTSRLESPVGRAALGLVVAVGMTGLQAEAATRGAEEEEAAVAAAVPPLYRDPGPIVTPLLAAVANVSGVHCGWMN